MIKKRTQQEIERSISVDKDFTGGYDYLNWIIFNGDGRAYILSSIGILIFGTLCFFTLQDSYAPKVQLWVGVGAVIVCIVINILSKRSFNHLKKGDQSL